MTLKELMGIAVNGDGRKFANLFFVDCWFEPILLAQGIWFGRCQDGSEGSRHQDSIGWYGCIRPKEIERKSEMTLKELMGDLDRGDGRRFANESFAFWFEPIFWANGIWCGKDQDGNATSWHDETPGWKEYAEPKKKIELWKWAYKGIDDKWAETNGYHAKQPAGNTGWIRIEGSRIEVEE